MSPAARIEPHSIADLLEGPERVERRSISDLLDHLTSGSEVAAIDIPDFVLRRLGGEPEMDERGYLIPGLGDAGSRLYKTA